jgi:general secretion pathway protein I
LSLATPSPADRVDPERGDLGFTIIEVLIALAIVAVSIVAIGSVMATNARGVQSLESHVALMQTARMVMATAVPPRSDIVPGATSGRIRDYRWQVDIGLVGGDWVVADADVPWIPQLVKLRVRSPTGATITLETVRLMHRPRQ